MDIKALVERVSVWRRQVGDHVSSLAARDIEQDCKRFFARNLVKKSKVLLRHRDALIAQLRMSEKELQEVQLSLEDLSGETTAELELKMGEKITVDFSDDENLQVFLKALPTECSVSVEKPSIPPFSSSLGDIPDRKFQDSEKLALYDSSCLDEESDDLLFYL